jgi:phage replication-related protein YjqB (UPF0714/DUF867 family)
VGGRHGALKSRLIDRLNRAGFRAQNDNNSAHAGRLSTNLCNRGRAGRGVQLELTQGLRDQLFVGLARAEREQTTPIFTALVDAVRAVLRSYTLIAAGG